MRREDYEIIRKALEPVRVLGNIDDQEVEEITNLQLEADRRSSITLQLEVLRRLLRKDLEEEVNYY